jgi:Ca2+-binding RTX toxin-like protein
VLVGGSIHDDSIDFLKLGENGITAEIRTQTPSGNEVVTGSVRPVANGFELTIDLGNGNITVVGIETTAAIGRLIAFGQAGDDTIRVSSQLDIDSLLYGDEGRDILVGGKGDSVLFGGEGDDALFGGDGRDILIGGDGVDRLLGQAEEDLLIGGFLAFADLDRAIQSIAREWNDRTLDYATRVAALSNPARIDGLVLGQTVFNDDDRDLLLGGQALDWYIADEEEDQFHAALDEIFTGIEESILDI